MGSLKTYHPCDQTSPHSHPDSVMVTLSSFKRRLRSGGREVELELPAFQARWLRRVLPFLYLPAASLAALQLDLAFFNGRFPDRT